MRSTTILSRRGFTLIELLVVVAVIAILAGMLLPVLARAKAKAVSTYCLSNTRQLNLAWVLYADEHNGRLTYNLGGNALKRQVAARTNANWVNNILDWKTDPDNTNLATLTEAALGPFCQKATGIYRCPADYVLSSDQQGAGWTARVRSYSMNAMMGNAGELSITGANENNPNYVQFFTMTAIPHPQDLFVFLDEHPDSINDGYFVNQGDYDEWLDLPASYHDRGANFSFADGHSESHHWHCPSTSQPSRPRGAPLPMYVPKDEHADFDWVTSHMSVERW